MENIEFKLNEKETQRSIKFIENHNHTDEFRKQGKLGFSTLGQQFSYIITPGGLGNSVTIKCNHCKQEENITDIDCW